MSQLPESDMYDDLQHRLVDAGVSHRRARELTTALLARDETRAESLNELARHLDGELSHLTDVLVRLDLHVADLSDELDEQALPAEKEPQALAEPAFFARGAAVVFVIVLLLLITAVAYFFVSR